MKKVIKGTNLIDGTGSNPIKDAVVIVDKDKITAVGSAKDIQLESGEQVEVIDASGKTIMPGLIDAHAHILVNEALAHSRQLTLAYTDEQLLMVGIRNTQLHLKGGITTLRECGGRDCLSLVIRDAINDNVITGPRMICAGPVITATGGHWWWNGVEADSAEEVRKIARTLLKRGVDFIKIMGTGGFGSPGSNVAASQYQVEAYRAAVEDAHRLGTHVAVHVHAVEAIRLATEAGVDTLEHVSFSTPEGIGYNEALVDQIAKKGIYMSLAFPTYWYPVNPSTHEDPEIRIRREARHDVIRRLFTSGAKVVASSDSTDASINHLSMLLEFLVERLGIPTLKVIHSATGLAAEAIGCHKEVGTLEPGKKADIMIVDGDLLSDITALQRVDSVLKDGEIVVSSTMLKL